MPEQLPSNTLLHTDVAPGVHRLECARTNLYLVQTGDRVLVVDAGLPAMWTALRTALDRVGAAPQQIDGVLLTHGHFDHVGLARQIHDSWKVPVWVHPADRRLAAHPYRYRPQRNRLLYTLGHTEFWPSLVRLLAAGAGWVEGIQDTHPIDDFTVPGAVARHGIRVLETPGHTNGHIAVHLPARDALLTGDALVTFDPYRSSAGPQIIAEAATADPFTNLVSLRALARTGARIVLPGHGDPWRDGVTAAVEQALAEAGSGIRSDPGPGRGRPGTGGPFPPAADS